MDQRIDWQDLQRSHEPRGPGVERLGGVLAEVLEGPAFRRAARLAGVGAALGEVLHPGLRERVTVGGVRAGKLVLWTAEPALAYDLRLGHDVLLSAIRRHCPEARVYELAIKVGEGAGSRRGER